MPKIIKTVGETFGKYTVIEELPERNKYRRKVYRCRCKCGRERILDSMRILACNAGCKYCSPREGLPPKNQDRINAIAKNIYKRIVKRNKRKEFSGDIISFNDFFYLSQKPCFYCGRIGVNQTRDVLTKNKRLGVDRISDYIFHYNGLDRIDNSMGYTKDNVVPCCGFCNRSKSDGSISEFFNNIEAVYKYNNLGISK